MCITTSVGKGSKTKNRIDIKTIQLLINFNIGEITPLKPLKVDGLIGDATYGAIFEFQSRVGKVTKPDSRVDPGGDTLKLLRKGIPKKLTKDVLRGIMPYASSTNINRYHPYLVPKMKQRSITTALRQSHFLAQIAHESGSLIYAQEIASGAAYEGRKNLGNTQKGDGVKFKGRGLLQLTGRHNYTKYGTDINVKLVESNRWTTVATSAERAVDSACWYWNKKGLNRLADSDDLRRVTRIINGGYNGLADRKKYLIRAKFFLGLKYK